MGVHKDTWWEWDFIWRRPLFDSEIAMAVRFLKDVEGKPIQPHRRDDWVWTTDPSSQYSTQSVYNMLRGKTIEGTQDGAFEELWKLKVLSKILVFAWRLLRDRLPTKINLQRCLCFHFANFLSHLLRIGSYNWHCLGFVPIGMPR